MELQQWSQKAGTFGTPAVQRRRQRLRMGGLLLKVTVQPRSVCRQHPGRELAWESGVGVGRMRVCSALRAWGLVQCWRIVSELLDWPFIWGSGWCGARGLRGPGGRRDRARSPMEEQRQVRAAG